MNNLTREQILEQYTKPQIQAELQKLNLQFENNASKENLIDLYFQHTYEVKKAYTADELDKFQVSTLYYLCKRLKITKFVAKGFIPQYQKVNFITEYLSYLRTRTDEQLKELSNITYPSSNRFVYLELLENPTENDYTIWDTENFDLKQIIYTIKERFRCLKTSTRTIDLIEFLYYATPEVLNEILEEIGNYPYKSLTLDEKICLITWHLYYMVDYQFLEDREFSLYLENTNLETISNRIIGEYKYPNDNATKLWILNTSCVPPVTRNHLNTRYQELLKLPATKINLLAHAYEEMPTSKYRILAFAETQSPLENYLLALDEKNLQIIKSNLGIMIPPTLKTSEVIYLQKNLIYYEKILRRKKEAGLPPKTRCTIDDLQWYTDIELHHYYDLKIIPTFENRTDLLQRIRHYLKNNYFWHIEYNKSANPNSHVIMREPRISEDDNAIVCFGNLIYYRAYNIDELMASFKHYDEDGFRFKVPDGNGYTADFSISEITKLMDFMSKCFPDEYKEFIEILEQGILFLGNSKIRLDKIRKWYLEDKKNNNDSTLEKFTILIFLLSMYMKKWKGPPEPFPLEWKEQRDLTILQGRDARTEMALSAYIQFLDSLEGPTRVKICEIPRISYDFKTEETRIGYETINGILELVSVGNFCLAHASDILLQTAYVLWTQVMHYNLNGINKQIKREIKCDQQPDFDPKLVTTTRHIDPTNQLRDF